MFTRMFVLMLPATCLLLSTEVLYAEAERPETRSIPAVQLPDTHGESFRFSPDENVRATVVCFLGAECPLVHLYVSKLVTLADQFRSQGVRFVAINSNRQDTPEDTIEFLRSHPLNFPLLIDRENVIADLFVATRTPEIFVLDETFTIRYQGRVDDQFEPGVTRPRATRDDLRLALEDVLSHVPVREPRTPVAGCMIGKVRKSAAPSDSDAGRGAAASNLTAKVVPETDAAQVEMTSVTWSRHIRPMFQRHCTECHRAGEIGPFELNQYERAVGWAETCLEVIDNGRMPPWHADREHGEFTNARHVPGTDRDLLERWIQNGMPRGEDADEPESAESTSVNLWQTEREPDLVIPMRSRPFRIPATGTVDYQYFVVDPGLTEDRWVSAAQVIPGNRAVVHHAIVFIRPPDDRPFRGVGWLTAYVPGQRLVPLPPGHARRVPAGSRFVFQMHYTTNGRAQEDLSQVGIVFADDRDVSDEVLTVMGINQTFEIPPFAEEHEVFGEVRWIPKQGKMLAVAPHMHVRGKSFTLKAQTAAGMTTVLHVPEYDFNWQHSYVFRDPLPLHDIEALTFRTAFDNSEKNPANPDPTQWVTWGDQTWEEMAVVFMEVSEPRFAVDSSSTGVGADQSPDKTPDEDHATDDDAETERKIRAFVDDFFQKVDTDGDGVVTRSEASVALRIRFRHFDTNGDQIIDRSEVDQVARRRFRP